MAEEKKQGESSVEPSDSTTPTPREREQQRKFEDIYLPDHQQGGHQDRPDHRPPPAEPIIPANINPHSISFRLTAN